MTISEFRTQFFDLVEKSNHVAITAHMGPDDDSIASVLSTYSLLKIKFPEKDIRIIYTGVPLPQYAIFQHFDQIAFVSDIAEHLDTIDMLVLLDCNKYGRSSLHPEILSQVPIRVCIDHHASPPDEFTAMYADPDASSNAQLVYKIFEAEQYLDKELAELFLLGILGDTGNLIHVGSHQIDVFDTVKKLIEVGDIRIDTFLSRFKTIPKRLMPLLQEFVKNTTYIEIPGWPPVQYSFVDRTFSEQFSDEDMSAGSHIYMGQYLTRVQGQSWGFVLSPRSDRGVRMSSRSNADSVNVRVFNEMLGVGGGHDRASGGSFKSVDGAPVAIDVCLEKIFDFMKNNKPVLG